MRLAWAAVVAAALAFSADAAACSCAPVDLVRDLPRADAAVVGTVLERRQEGTEAVYRLRVEQVYKGNLDARVEVVTASDGAACGLAARVGDRLGLLLERKGDTWRTGLCSQVDPSEFLEVTDVDDASLPPLNWGGIVLGTLVLAGGAFFLVRRLRAR
jgi:hypothetical protein